MNREKQFDVKVITFEVHDELIEPLCRTCFHTNSDCNIKKALKEAAKEYEIVALVEHCKHYEPDVL